MRSHRRITLAFLATLALLGGVGPAAAQSLDPAPKPDPAPAAVKQQQSTPKATPSSSSRSYSPPARTYTPQPVVSPTSSSSSAPTQSSSTRAKAANARAAKAKAAKAKAAKAKAAKARAAKAKRPVVIAPVRSTPAHAFTPPVDASSKGGSGLNLSDGGVLLVTFLLALGIGVLVLLLRAVWRRVAWGWRYRRADAAQRRRREVAVEDVPDVLQWSLHDDPSNGSNGTTKDDAEPIRVTPRSGADAPTGT